MRFYAKYIAQRLLQFLLVVFIGINLTYVITHATPIDPVEQSISAVTSFGNTSPEAINMMRQSLRELYGLTGGPYEQYVNFWRRIAVADFGPSLSAFPTPVSTLIARALPWTIGLLTTATLLTWALGNLLGGWINEAMDWRTAFVMVGLLNSRKLRRSRRGAWVGIAVFAALITPTQDWFTMTAMMVPLLIFYELSILVARFVLKK
jgi:ABC-type dipeptide/oligopeptide/nickel transport system permease component